jgi:glycosyltransferase involved in cell wall biosynthesis
VLLQILFCVLLLSIVVQFGYVLHFFARMFLLKPGKPIAGDKKPVSIVICAKNEAQNLRRYLPLILAQRYSNESGKSLFEVIVVNDASDDDTEVVIRQLAQQHDNLRWIDIAPDAQRTMPGKKFALNHGIAQASYEYLLLTDADCAPSSVLWLEKMVAPLHEGKQIVAGVGKFAPHDGWLNTFIRWETMHTFLQYSTYAMAGMPYMAVGRNLACTKTIFQQAQQAAVWKQLPSGDDDLLMRMMATKENTAIVCEPEAFTISEAKNNFDEWVAQKQRHVSTGKYYKRGVILTVGMYACIHALTWLVFLILLPTGYGLLALSAMAARCAVYWLLWGAMVDKMQEKKLNLAMPLVDIGWMLYNFAVSPYVLWKNKMQWK